MKLLPAAALAALCVSSLGVAQAQAQNYDSRHSGHRDHDDRYDFAPIYGGVDYSYVQYKPENSAGLDDGELNPSSLRLRIGSQFSPYLAVEAHYGLPIASDDIALPGDDAEFELSYFWGLYGKAILPLTPDFSLYGLAGYAKVESELKQGNLSTTEANDGLSYGVGLDWRLADRLHLNFDYVSLFDDEDEAGDDLSVRTFNAGLRFDF